MRMNRRGFVASLLATALMDPEKLLWVPGKKSIFIPTATDTYSFTDADIGDWRVFIKTGPMFGEYRIVSVDRGSPATSVDCSQLVSYNLNVSVERVPESGFFQPNSFNLSGYLGGKSSRSCPSNS